MKATLIVLSLVCMTAFASPATLFSTISSQLKLSTNMKDVFQTVYREIELLEQSIMDEQTQADADIADVQATCATTIGDLEGIENNAKTQYEEDKAATEALEAEDAQVKADIVALQERYDRNLNRMTELEAQRCEDAMLFVKDLMSHKESLELLELLQQELIDYFAQPDQVGFLSIMTKVELLETYSQVFKENTNALAQIKQILSTGDELYAKNEVAHGEETKNLRTDNDQGGIVLDDYERASYTITGDLEIDINNLVQQLVDHMYESITNLEENEIQAAHDFAKWQRDIERENEANRQHLDTLLAREAELVGEIEAAQEKENTSQSLYEDAAAATQDMRDLCDSQTADYNAETAVRNEELVDVRECLRLFEEELLEDNTTQYTKDVAGGLDANAEWEVHDTTHDRTDYTETGTFTHEADEGTEPAGEL